MSWTSPRTWVAGEKPTAATMNTHIRDNLKAIGDAWTAWTPTLTNLTLGSGTLVTRYMAAGKLTHFYFDFTFGSGSAVGSGPQFTLPVPALSAAAVRAFTVRLTDISAATHYIGVTTGETTTAVSFAYHNTGALSGITATGPFTWATGDILHCHGTYEGA